MGPRIKAQKKTEVYNYMMELTEKFEKNTSSGYRAASSSYISHLLGVASSLVLLASLV